jgi:hypothetical protein
MTTDKLLYDGYRITDTPPWVDRKSEIRKFTDIEASWLASAIDGEGSFGLYDYGKEGRRVCIQVGNTNEDYVKEFKRIIGCGSSVLRHKFGPDHKGRKPMYHYTLKGSCRCYWVLVQVIPYLIIKKSKAEDIVQELIEKPFGRWANATEESRKRSSDSLKSQWADPVIRKRRIDGMRKAAEDKRNRKLNNQ